MKTSRTVGGVHVVGLSAAEAGRRFSQAELALMRGADRGYLRTRAAEETARAERLGRSLHAVGASAEAVGRRHVLFADTAEEAAGLDPAERLGTAPALLGRAHNRLRVEQLADPSLVSGGAGLGRRRAADALPGAGGAGGRTAPGAARRALLRADGQRRLAYAEAARARRRGASLARVEARLELTAKLSGKGGRGVTKTVVGGEATPYADEGGTRGGTTVYKWRRRRAG